MPNPGPYLLDQVLEGDQRPSSYAVIMYKVNRKKSSVLIHSEDHLYVITMYNFLSLECKKTIVEDVFLNIKFSI